MVRLVFRPYTQIRRTICTSVSLRASTKFPLASPCSGIVHHLSGPNGYALTQIYDKSRSVDGAFLSPVDGVIPTSAIHSCLHFHYASEFYTQTLAYTLDSLVRVSRRVDEYHFVRILKHASGQPVLSPKARM